MIRLPYAYLPDEHFKCPSLLFCQKAVLASKAFVDRSSVTEVMSVGNKLSLEHGQGCASSKCRTALQEPQTHVLTATTKCKY